MVRQEISKNVTKSLHYLTSRAPHGHTKGLYTVVILHFKKRRRINQKLQATVNVSSVHDHYLTKAESLIQKELSRTGVRLVVVINYVPFISSLSFTIKEHMLGCFTLAC